MWGGGLCGRDTHHPRLCLKSKQSVASSEDRGSVQGLVKQGSEPPGRSESLTQSRTSSGLASAALF